MRTNDIFRKIIRALALDIQQIQSFFSVSDIFLSEKEITKLLKKDY